MRNDGLVAIDWGTTNRRMFLLDGTGAVVRREADGLGIAGLSRDALGCEMARLRAAFGERPFLLAGMIGSNRGWHETPYLPCPLSAPQLAGGLVWVEPGRTAIVPGACVLEGERADVMRGEEVQLLGAAAAGLVPSDALLCLPGTHAKWARLEGGALASFRTAMTGELFALLRTHSILAGQLKADVRDGPPFREGVRRGLGAASLLSDLFGTRARVLLGRLREEDASSYLSGLLIGADLAIALADGAPGRVALIGDPALTRLYGAALAEAGRDHLPVDGEQAFLAGIRTLWETLP